jgi:hypothetical protein
MDDMHTLHTTFYSDIKEIILNARKERIPERPTEIIKDPMMLEFPIVNLRERWRVAYCEHIMQKDKNKSPWIATGTKRRALVVKLSD